METRAHYILIGLFTVVVVAGTMWFVLWLAKSGPAEDADVYDIVFREAVTGLSIGSRVLYNGIHVGKVERIGIDPDDPRQVIARIRVSNTTPVKQDTRAELILANVTGASEIQLIGGSAQSPPLERVNDSVPKIIAEPSRIARLSSSLTELIEDISILLENSNRLMSEENAANLTRSLENLNELTGTLAGQSEEIRRGMQSLSRLSQKAEQLLRENEAALAGGMQGLSDLGPALEELRRTMAALRGAVQRFDQDPGGYLFSREPIREFQP